MLHRLTVFRRKSWLQASLSLLITAAPALADPPPSDVSIRVKQAVLGIMSYTRWPTPPIQPRLCVIGQPGLTEAFFAGPMQLDDRSVKVTREMLQAGHLGEQCDAVYAGALTLSERELLRLQLTGHPVLTITESDPQCSGGSMFCLDMTGAERGGQVLFAVNLDSVARSGVQVNPRVLLLGRRRKSPP